ncbi:MAG: hypothetical protein IKT75_04370 [Alistipes sp.]|nr:hypothetical protein [Alistipes sp.]
MNKEGLMFLLPAIFPVLAIIGYFADVQWLYLVGAAISLYCHIKAVYGLLVLSLFAASCIVVGILTSSFMDGLLLGSAAFFLIVDLLCAFTPLTRD